MEKNAKKAELEKFQAIIDWTLPGLSMYYRDANFPPEIIEKYTAGAIFRAPTFVDVSNFAGRPRGNCRFIIASSKAAPIYKFNKGTEKWGLHVLNWNSCFKVLDIFENSGITQIFLLHIPFRGLELFRQIKLKLGNQNMEDQFIEKARTSLDQKLAMEIPPALLELEWIKRTELPIGLNQQNEFFPLKPEAELPPIAKPLYQAIRKMTNDGSDLNEFY